MPTTVGKSVNVSRLRAGAANCAARLARTFIARGRRVWIFGAWFGDRYCDNPRHLFEYVARQRREIFPVWLSRKRAVVEAVRERGFYASQIESREASLWARSAEAVVTSIDANNDIGWRGTLGQAQVCLWHGMPIKKIGADAPRREGLHPSPDLLISTSPTTQKVLMGAFGLTDDKVRVTGEPRADILFSDESELVKLKRHLFPVKASTRIISYLPTHRDPETSSGVAKSLASVVEEFQNSNELAGVLAAHDAVLVVKGHFHQGVLRQAAEATCQRIIVVPPSSIFDTNELLAVTDILVTDYSSCYFDFLLTGRPVLFFCRDQTSYVSDSRPFYYDYSKIAAGIMAKSFDELVGGMKNYLCDSGKDAAVRRTIRDLFHQYRDGSASQRVADEIIRLVDERNVQRRLWRAKRGRAV